MKTLLQLFLVLSIFVAANDTYPQQQILSAGKAPFNKVNSHSKYGRTLPPADIAYAHDNSTSQNIFMPIPEGHPFTVLGNFSAPNFASGLTKGGDDNYYLTDVGAGSPGLYLFDPNAGTCTLKGNISGMGADQPNGIAYDFTTDTYFMVSSSAFYSLDINTLAATLIGSFSITGLMIDLCVDGSGTIYSYDVDITPGAANGYIIDKNTGGLTALGYVGFTPNYGQGMSYDYETEKIYLSAFNSDTFSGQLRTMDKNTGMTTLVYDWVDQIDPFAVEGWPCCCSVPSATNPNPPTGTGDVSINGITLFWDNGAGATMTEVWFGSAGNVVKLYDGPLINSWDTGLLEYYTTYHWYIIDKNDTCGCSSPTWVFTTEQNPNLHIDDFYPQSAQYWTGSTDGAGKFDGEINTVYPNVGWASYDISEIPVGSTVQEVHFYGYVNAANWPYWSATPLSVDPVSADADTINSQILSGYDQSVAYIYSDESSSFGPGWHDYPMENSALADLQAAVNSGQGWFAMGFLDRDFSDSYFVNFDGWSQANPPYIKITFVPIPVELTSFRADVQDRKVVLNWITATETNNRGFIVQRQSSNANQSINQSTNQWSEIGFVEGNGTTTLGHSYSFIDNNVPEGKYNYRLKQIDFDGSFEYSNEIEVEVTALNNFSLEQNYPNPFNPTTRINFNLRSDSRVTLGIYNVLGQKVSELLNDRRNAGSYNVEFDASRLELTSGIYFYSLIANGLDGSNFIDTKKMILIK